MKVRLLKKNTWWGRSGFREEPIYYFQIKVLFWWETQTWIAESSLEKGKYVSAMQWFEINVKRLKEKLAQENKRHKEVGWFGKREVIAVVEIQD